MTQHNDSRALMENALKKINRLNGDIKALDERAHEPIAIVGIGCRYPGADEGVEQFWRNLCDGVDSVSPLTDQRWNQQRFFDPQAPRPGKTYSPNAGLLADVLRFDAQLFGITPREAECMDPQQRTLLEVTWQALEDAGMPPDSVRGANAGVFTGIMNKDHSDLLVRHLSLDEIAAHMNAGNHESVHSGRVSYTFDFKGPCLTLNTACSSSLVTVHLACQSLRLDECDFALAGGCNVILAPTTSVAQSQAMMHSPQGLCKAFDASANGYVRAEGCGVVVLKRLSRAVADGDHIYALIRGSAVNQDGLSQGIMAPNGPSQVRVIRSALANARVNPKDVGYVEAHGTGTKLGDPIELQSLGAVYGRAAGRDTALRVGSLKTNIGHSESAAGVAGIIKVAKALQQGEIPPQLHFNCVNPFVDLDDENIAICTDRQAWPSGTSASRLAAVSSFGFSGTNAHIIMESYSPVPSTPSSVEQRPHLLFISAREKLALDTYASQLLAFLESSDEQALADICYSQNGGRRQFEQRIAVSGNNRAELIHTLQHALDRPPQATQPIEGAGQVGWVMGVLTASDRERYRAVGQSSLAFQCAYTECMEIAGRTLAIDLDAPVLNPQAQRLADAALFYGHAIMWRSFGVQPRWIVAHSTMQGMAAVIAGNLSLDKGLQRIAAASEQVDACAYVYRPGHDGALPYAASGLLEQALEREPVQTVIALGTLDHPLWDQPAAAHVAQPVWATIAATLAGLYEAGAPIVPAAWDTHAQRRKLPLPTYAFQGSRYWLKQLDALNDHTQACSTAPPAPEALAAPAGMTTRDYVKYLIRHLAKMEDKPLDEESLLIDDIGFDSLMLAELRTRIERTYPNAGKVSLELLHTQKLGLLLDFVEQNAGTDTLQPDMPQTNHALDFAIGWLTQWNSSGRHGETRRMDKRHVHKSSESNVLLGDMAAIGDTGWYAAELFHDANHPFFYEHAQDHIPGLYLIEAARQFGIACTHVFQGVPREFPFVLDDMRIRFDSFAEHDAPVYLLAQYTDLMFKNGHLHRSHSHCHIVQNGVVLGTIEGRGLILPPADYQAARALETTH
ncbi:MULTISPECIES: beta-ketoacyl synthase N-terminal-like domain-containing protein [unclassified Pseudomonas]|uniref:beta-ketoacyl synthase N-terminal-like domain-containing protein n=1 Tax=unclassified Pseudomonas TaxID=196821 RepID=UPI0039B72581